MSIFKVHQNVKDVASFNQHVAGASAFLSACQVDRFFVLPLRWWQQLKAGNLWSGGLVLALALGKLVAGWTGDTDRN
jgi:hypothetical protein